MRNVKQIGDTPLSINVYSVEQTATHLHERGILEIIFCLKGSVKFTYSYEEFTLNEGEFVSVDRDAYYLYDGRDNLCVSFFIDLKRYEEKDPYILNRLFVCEGIEGNKKPDLTNNYDRLKGLMISILKQLGKDHAEDRIAELVNQIVYLFLSSFDIFFYHAGNTVRNDEIMNRVYTAGRYLYQHHSENIAVADLAKEMNLTENYLSKYLSKYSIGFRRILNYLRASESEHYLLNTDKTIMEISEECGFSDVKYYYTAFREWYKCTPRQFRERYKNAREEIIKERDIDDVRDIIDELLIEHYLHMFIS